MIKTGARLGGLVLNGGNWYDLGTRDQYLHVHRELHRLGRGDFIASEAVIAPEARLLGATAVAPGAQIGRGAVLQDCVVWENAVVEPGAQLTNCIVTAGTRVSGAHTDADF
ncbi:MAG: hypothetical protein QM796_07980 [Chthoniobacteraceae bacterium]